MAKMERSKNIPIVDDAGCSGSQAHVFGGPGSYLGIFSFKVGRA